MEISIEELQTYLDCPAKYLFEHKYNLPKEKNDRTEYNQAIHKTISYLYFSMLGERLPSAKQMKDKWASIWQEAKGQKGSLKDTLLQDRQPVMTDNRRVRGDKYVVDGMELIHNFYHFNKDKFGIPIAVDQEFRVPINGVTITGKFELVRESIDKSTSNRFIEIVDFKTGSKVTDNFLIQNDLRMTIMAYAFRNLFNGQEDRLVYNYLKTGEEVYTRRTEKEFDRMKATITAVAEGLQNERFYPRQSFMCKSCPFKDACSLAEF